MTRVKHKWLWDQVSPDLIHLHSIEELLFSGRSSFQRVEIVRTATFGLCLLLDGKIQSCEGDEAIYHEALVHPALLAHRHPRRVLIAGGGEGAALREVLTHKTVEQAVMVDIDAEVMDICRKHLPSFHQGAFEDPRTTLHCANARDFVAEHRDLYDVIILDLSDPLEEGPSYLLFTSEFYSLIQQRLSPGGIVSVQSGSASRPDLDVFKAVYTTLKSVFPLVFPYHIYVPSFGGPWGFCLASRDTPPPHSPEEVDARISARVLKPLKVYDGMTHLGMFSLPKHLRQELSQSARIITDGAPLVI